MHSGGFGHHEPMTIAINVTDDRQTERLSFEEKSTDELLADRKKLRESIQRSVNAALCDGRPDLSETPIVDQDEDYREDFEKVTNELIDRGAI